RGEIACRFRANHAAPARHVDRHRSVDVGAGKPRTTPRPRRRRNVRSKTCRQGWLRDRSAGGIVMTISPAKEKLVHCVGLPRQKISYEQARDLLDHPDPEVRRGLAARDNLEPEILFYLANDPDVEVRRAIATNHATPAKASLVLAFDADADVRCDL